MILRTSRFCPPWLWISFATMTIVGCDCGEEPAGPGADLGVVPVQDAGTPDSSSLDSSEDTDGAEFDAAEGDGATEADAGAVDDSGRPIPDAGALDDAGQPIPDSGAVDDAGNPFADGGSELGQPLADFCAGEGAVISVGGDPNDCSGNLAQNTFQYAICACEGVVLQSNLECDAFDSRLGPYGTATTSGPNILEDGHIGVNGTLQVNGMVNVLGSVFVAGGGFEVGQQSFVSINVYAAGDANQANSSTDIGRNMFIDGNVTGRYDISQNLYVPPMAMVSQETANQVGGSIIYGAIPPVTPCPCGPGQIVDVQSYVDYGRMFNDNVTLGVLTSTTWATGTGPDVITLPCGRYYLTQIIHPRGITIRAQDRTVLFVDGNVTLGGGLRIELDPGAELDFFIAGSLALQAASRLGDEDHPSAVRTYVGGSDPIVLSANTLFGGNLYAPSADVSFEASANLFGALFCKNAIFSGSADVHFDNSIRAAGQNCTDGGVEDDAGVPAPDTGVPSPDAGVPPDGGPMPCDECTDCPAASACLLPPDAGVGVCGPCTSDLDCCPFEICDENTGLCRPTI